jgi:hypothetical protein
MHVRRPAPSPSFGVVRSKLRPLAIRNGTVLLFERHRSILKRFSSMPLILVISLRHLVAALWCAHHCGLCFLSRSLV